MSIPLSEPEASATVASSPADGVRYVRLLNLLAVTQIALFLTTAIWVPPWKFPQVPLFAMCRDWPVWLEVVFFVMALAGTFFAKRPEAKITRRVRHAICALGFAGLFLTNQHRIQPWAYQFFILHAWLALVRPRWMLTGWRWLTISIYVYSALSKFDYAFCVNHGPFLLDGFLQAIGIQEGTARWPANIRFLAGAIMPAVELSTALLLCFRRTQSAGLVISILMHLFLIVALGPGGHNHSAGVLIWNAFFIVQNWLLFPSPVVAMPFAAVETNSPGGSPGAKTSSLAWAILAAAMVAPLGEPWGLWDHWPSWAVYAARPERTTVFVHEDDVDKIPAELRGYLQPPGPLDVWHPIRLDRWSLETGKVPMYPQARFQVGIALALAQRCELTTLKVVLESPPHRWTGQRTQREFVSLPEIEALAATYRLNALPRSILWGG